MAGKINRHLKARWAPSPQRVAALLEMMSKTNQLAPKNVKLATKRVLLAHKESREPSSEDLALLLLWAIGRENRKKKALNKTRRKTLFQETQGKQGKRLKKRLGGKARGKSVFFKGDS